MKKTRFFTFSSFLKQRENRPFRGFFNFCRTYGPITEISRHHWKERVKITSDTFYTSEDKVFLRKVAKNLQTFVSFVPPPPNNHHHHHRTIVC